MRVHPAGGGDSHGGVVAVFTNHSASACRLYGYPGAADVNAAGRQIEQAKRTLTGYLGGCRCTTPAPLRLGPGASASALIEGTNADAKGDAACLRGRSILVTPPNTRTSTTASFSGYSCDFQVHPVVAGRSGSK